MEDKQANAWCMPGGKVVVYTGILPVTKDENGLAVVLGHEIAHAVANHRGERMSQAPLVEMGGLTLDAALSQNQKKTNSLFLAAYGLGAQVGILLPYSRVQESEAEGGPRYFLPHRTFQKRNGSGSLSEPQPILPYCLQLSSTCGTACRGL